MNANVNWTSANQFSLVAELEKLKQLLRRRTENPPQETGETSPPPNPENQTPQPSALDALCAAFSLSPFERSILLLCAGIELDSAFAPLCAAAQGDSGRPFPTFSLALAALPDPHWSALAPEAPLRRWRLIEVAAGSALTMSPLRIDERVLHYLAGITFLDERLAAMVEPIRSAAATGLAPSHETIVKNIVAALSAARENQRLPVIQLCAAETFDCRSVAVAIATALGLRAVALSAELIPVSAPELDTFLRLAERESVLGHLLMVVECDADSAANDDARTRNIYRLVEKIASPIIIVTREPRRIPHRPAIIFQVNRPTTAEQCAAWRAALASEPGGVSLAVDSLAAQFNLSLPSIRSVASAVASQAADLPDVDVVAAAWQFCRARCRTRLDGLAQRIEPAAVWEDLVLPEAQLQTLRQIAIQVRQRATVYESWGFATKSSRGLGIAALFAGVSGTGKTMAAEVIAAELRLDLYRIDLASVVSKYIGETEKNLRRVFDAAEESGAILLFDEADALFGKRSEVKDSHDRYANIEVSYLLQRMEAYRGLAILTTNLKSALDAAFFRRLRFVVQFPFPDPSQRAEIWRRIFPKTTPVENLDFGKLGRLNVPGGNIRNIAMNSAFLAADDGKCVRMSHLLTAVRAEFTKLERPLTEAEIGGWI